MQTTHKSNVRVERIHTININFEERECESMHWIEVVQSGIQWSLYGPQASDSISTGNFFTG